MIESDAKNLKKLTSKQTKYFRMMLPCYGILYITGEPGIAKTAIVESMAKKLERKYFDVRLSMIDEIDVGLFPYRKEVEIDYNDGSPQNVKKIISLMAYAIPEWAYESNQQPSIIAFEELNRAPLAVRNAALQIILERRIGTKFKFNDNVIMCATGNLGDADGTEVDEFDRALNNRLIHVKHSLDLPEWIEDFASEHIHPVVVNFLKSNEEHFLHSLDEKRTKDNVAYATPRTWTMLSEYIVKNYGMTASIREFIGDMREYGASYVGDGANSRFIRYLDESLKFGIKDLLERYDEYVEQLKELNRDKKSELLNSLKTIDIMDLEDYKKENVKKFILSISEDEAVSFILKLIDKDYKYLKVNDQGNDIAEEFLTDIRFAKFYDAILKHVPNFDN